MRSPRFQSPAASRGVSLLEILVAIGIIAALASLLFPVFGSLRSAAAATKCSSNLRQIGALAHSWSLDHNGWIPQGRWYIDNLPAPYSNLRKLGLTDALIKCSSNTAELPNYGINSQLVTSNPQWGPRDVYYWEHGKYKAALLSPSTIFFAETAAQDWSGKAGAYIAGPGYLAYPHRHKTHVLFADGHVEQHTASEMKDPALWRNGLPD